MDPASNLAPEQFFRAILHTVTSFRLLLFGLGLAVLIKAFAWAREFRFYWYLNKGKGFLRRSQFGEAITWFIKAEDCWLRGPDWSSTATARSELVSLACEV